MRKTFSVMALATLAALLGACGGGDSFGSSGGTPGTPGGTVTVAMGSPAGAAFQEGALGISNSDLSAGGSTSLQVVLQKSDGTLVTDSVDVTFSSSCIGQNLATVQSPVTTTTGVASTTYVAAGCSGDDLVTATATVDGTQLTASGTITVATAAVGSIQFVSATPTNIALKGTGGAGRQETSTVVFNVIDSSGGPRPNADVTFSLDTQVGGTNLSATTAVSDANGRVQTVVNAGTVASTVRVTARIASPAISTQSSQLTITTGIPDTDSFSVAPVTPNVEAFDHDGVIVAITARLADRFNNPVPDGTAVTFQAEGGSIIGQCTTTTTALEGGACTVNWRSSDPRPADGRVTILATAIGEDSFTDQNSNGFFDTGEPFADLGEPFRDDDENDTHDLGEPFFDFNNDGVFDTGDSTFSGVTCTGTSPGSTCNLTTTGIGARTVIVMSTDQAAVTGPATITVAHDATTQVAYNVKDLNGNAMASGTTIIVSASAGAGTLGPPTNFTVPSDSSRNGFNVPVFLTGASAAGSGLITITVTSPGGLITLFTIPVTVT